MDPPGAAPSRRHRPSSSGVDHLREITADRECAATHIDVLLELRQSEPLVSDVVDSPPRLHCKLQHPSERQPERYGKACAKIAFAVPTRNAVYGQHHNVDACVLRALQHCPVEASILVEIELINLRRIVCLTQLIETHRAERRHTEHRAIFRSRGRDGAFTLMMEQALQGSGRAIDRQRELLAHDGNGQIDARNPAQDVGYEIAAFEGFCVAPVRRLLVRGAVDIIEDRTRQSPLGQTPKIMKVMTIAQNHACSRANPSVDQTARRRDLTAATEQTREYARIFEPATSESGSMTHFRLPA